MAVARSGLVVLWAAGLAMCAGVAVAQNAVTLIARTGTQVPWEPAGVAFARPFNPPPPNQTVAFGDSAIDARGMVTFLCLYPGGPGPYSAVARGDGGPLTPIALTAQPDAAHGGVLAYLNGMMIFDEGAAGGMIVEGPGAMQFGYATTGPVAVVALTGDAAAPTAGDTWAFQSADLWHNAPNFSFNRAGEGVFAHSVTNGSGIFSVVGYIDPMSGARELLRAGVAPPNAPPTPPGQPQPIMARFKRPVIGAEGTIAVVASMNGTDQHWLLVGAGTGVAPVLNAFQDVVGMPPGARLDRTTYPGTYEWPSASIAPDGRIAAILQFSGAGIPVQGALVAGDAGGVQAWVREGDALPGLAPGKVVRLGSPYLAKVLTGRGGLIAFQAYISTPTGSLDKQGIFAGTPGSGFRTVAQPGDPFAAVGADGTIVTATLAGINSFQDVLADVTVAGMGVTAANDHALAVFSPDLGTNMLLREGSPLELAPGDVRTVASFTVFAGSTWGRNSQINDSRQVAVVVAFADGSEAVVRLTPPFPAQACRADFNRSGGLDTMDVLGFVAAWFAGEPRADFDGVNSLGTPDIFAFLNAWFSGC